MCRFGFFVECQYPQYRRECSLSCNCSIQTCVIISNNKYMFFFYNISVGSKNSLEGVHDISLYIMFIIAIKRGLRFPVATPILYTYYLEFFLVSFTVLNNLFVKGLARNIRCYVANGMKIRLIY